MRGMRVRIYMCVYVYVVCVCVYKCVCVCVCVCVCAYVRRIAIQSHYANTSMQAQSDKHNLAILRQALRERESS